MKEISVILLFIVSFFLFYSVVGVNQPIYAIPDFNFGTAGDWGCSSNTQATVNNINGKNPERVLALGDYSYQSSATCWLNTIQPIDGVTRINIGNHENNPSEDFSTYMSHFGLSNPYYSYNYQNIHVLTIATESSFSSGSSQYNFVVNDLQTASQNPNIKWIIVNFHKVMYTSPNTCGSSSCSNTGSTAQSLRNNYHALFDQYGVDLVLQGHVHNYQRTYPIKYSGGSSPTITDSNSNNYIDPQGEIFATVGTGGVNFHALSGKAAFVVSQQDSKFGGLNLDFTNNGTKVTGKFFANDGTLMDQFTITKSPANMPPVANNQAVTVNKDTPTPITLTATDANNDPLTCSIVTQPLHGTIPQTGPCGIARTYTPVAGYVGPDSFTFKANDGTVDSNTATVTINVIVPAQGNYNYAPSFTATGSNYFDSASTPSLQLSQFSVAAWFKTSTNFASEALIVNKGGLGSETSGQNMNYGIWMTSTEQIVAGFETSSGINYFATSPNTYNDNQWHYAVVTYDGATVKLYVDGVLVASISTSGASPDTSGTQPARVGANSRVTPPGEFFTGQVDEVRVWNNDLTAQQVADATAGTSFNTGEQVLYLSFATSGAGTDIFGIKKLYPTKNNGEEWYMNMNNPLGDSRFNPQNTITMNPDGSWKMKSTQVRMNVYTSTGYDSANIPTLDHSVIASKGYMLTANDWRNFEMTQYVKVNTSPSDDNFAPYGRGGRHTGSGPPEGCEGSSIKGDVFFSGKVRFAKEQWHVSYVFTNIKTATGSLEDKWVGIKFIVYNFVENNKVVVKTELWLDINNNGNFVKVDENVDRGGWGTEGTACGGAPDQIISWGGPITTFRWDTATDVDFKNLSVREIVPQ
jgi:hypothetical protein